MNIGVNAAAGIVTAAAFRRPWTDGLMIFTQPNRATSDLKGYEAMLRGESGAREDATPGRDVTLSLSPREISLGIYF